MHLRFLLSLISLVSIAIHPKSYLPAEEVDFSKDVLPILADKCFVCHGPDSHPDTDLRLDSEAGATADRGGYQAVNLSQPEQSEMIARILDADDPMPPQDAEKQLSESEKEVLTHWIMQGGKYESHWAWIPPAKAKAFPTSTAAIDSLIQDQWINKGFEFAPNAPKSVLARRAALILTGLPPDPEWLSDFMADDSSEAFSRLVDRLLDSPLFGEHQARYWLDAVRYGDTHGLHLDNRRGIYPYRDWVVRAFNENMPLDEFMTWQLAGDLLDSPSMEQRLATGFIRMNPSTGEGGAIAEEFQMKNNFDRVETFGTVFLGLSLTCARCHTHKYDPIEHEEYYKLLAFFNNTAESALDGNSYTYGSTLSVPADQIAWDKWKQLEAEADALISADGRMVPLESLNQYAEQTAASQLSGWASTLPMPIEPDSPDPNLNATAKPIQGLPGTVSIKQWKDRLPQADQSIKITVTLETKIDQTFDLSFSGGTHSTVSLKDLDSKPNATAETSDIRGEENEKLNPILEITQSEPTQPSEIALWIPQGKYQLIFVVNGFEGMDSLTINLSNRWNELAKTKNWNACNLENQLLMAADPAGPFHIDLTLEESQILRDRAEQIAEKVSEQRGKFTTSLVAVERPSPRVTRVLRRGEYHLPIGEALAPGTPSILGGWSEDLPNNRLGLAQWLTLKENPLVARVLVNRIWQRVFGSGLVRTPEDFGVQGQQPTHPELLDWLAVDLIDTDWNLKELLRSMLLSRTFQQSSSWDENVDDPENLWLTRASSYRLDAEVLRDLGLWASDQLITFTGGEGIKPYQPPGMWAALAHPASNTKNYQRDSGERLNRRSLYVYWKRTSPHPMMTLFDAPDRESSCVRRSRTNTPLQSLGMLNETQRVEIGRAFAQHLLSRHDTDTARINGMFLRITCRQANVKEQEACLRLLTQMRERFQTSPQDAKEFLEVGETSFEAGVTAEELAAWSVLTTTFLASDQAIMLY